jgi:flavodoxin
VIVRYLVTYMSVFGNTRKVADTIARELEAAGTGQVISLEELSDADLDGVNLVVAGVPTHKMKLPNEAKAFLSQFPPKALRGRVHAAFDTSYEMSGLLARHTAAKKLDERLRKLGGKRLVAPETFHVVSGEGPLADGELDRAKMWARTVLKSIKSGEKE